MPENDSHWTLMSVNEPFLSSILPGYKDGLDLVPLPLNNTRVLKVPSLCLNTTVTLFCARTAGTSARSSELN